MAPEDVAQCVASGVAVGRGVRRRADAESVAEQDDDAAAQELGTLCLASLRYGELG